MDAVMKQLCGLVTVALLMLAVDSRITTAMAAASPAPLDIAKLDSAALNLAMESTDGWVGSGQSGLLLSSGNASALAVNGKLDLARSDGIWRQAVFLSALYGRNQAQVSGERGEFRYQLDRQFAGRNYWFTGVDAVRDLFSGFDARVTISSGFGRRFIDSNKTKLSANVGIGYEMFREQTLLRDDHGDIIGRVSGPAIHSLAGTFGLKGEQTLSANTKVLENLAVITASGETSIANDLALTVAMGGQLALSVGYGIRANTNPPPGAKKLDQTTSVNIVYRLR
jgi:putative salt-induced outer membrane protein